MSKVAIIIPTYNRGANRLLEKAMLSALGQTYTDISLVVVDDGSTDNTRELVTEYSDSDDRVLYIRRERTQYQKFGASAARNRGIQEIDNIADVEYVTFLDSDDMLPKDSVKSRVQLLEQQKGHVIGSSIGYCYKDMTPRLVLKPPLTGEDVIKNVLARYAKGFPHNSMLFRRQLLDKIGFYDEGIGFGEDRDFTIRTLKLLREGQLVLFPNIEYYYRRNKNGVCAHYKRNRIEATDSVMVDRKHGKTVFDEYVDLAKTAFTAPHTFLPESVKSVLRPVQESFRMPDFEIDPFVKEIETKLAA